jgi:hypothetical protein
MLRGLHILFIGVMGFSCSCHAIFLLMVGCVYNNFNASKDQLPMSRFIRTFKARKLFLDALEVGDSISRAAQAAGGTARVFKRWRDEDESFAKDWEEAEEAGTDYIEDAATDRALKKSDPLMLAILKARRPDKYDRASKIEHSGGIDVTGSKAKLLNRIARLQAAGQLPTGGDAEEPEVLAPEPPEEKLLLPAPDTGVPQRGRKRRAAEPGNRRKAAA